MNFLEYFLDFTKYGESPVSYFRWSALSCISAVMRDNLYQEWDYNKLYPNMYIILVGPPALGKGLPLRIAGKMIKEAKNTKVIEGSASIQAVIKHLGGTETGGVKGASGIVYSEEFSDFFTEDKITNKLLTDMYDYHEVWDRNLISWSASLKNLCLSVLAASNEVLLKDVFDHSAMYGGLLSRTLIVAEKRKRRKDPLTRAHTDIPSPEPLITHVKNLAKIKGPITFDEYALSEFELWYESWDEFERTKTGIEGRMKTHIKKVAMALAMCESELELVVKKCHVEYAIELCLGLYKNYQIIGMEGGRSAVAQPGALLIRILINAEEFQMSRKAILRRHWGELDHEILDKTVATMKEGELLFEVNGNNEVAYRLTPKALEFYSEVQGEKHKKKGA